MGTLHCTLENEADLYVNERQKIRYYRARSTEERRIRRMKKNAKSLFFTSRGACVNLCYIAIFFLLQNNTISMIQEYIISKVNL